MYLVFNLLMTVSKENSSFCTKIFICGFRKEHNVVCLLYIPVHNILHEYTHIYAYLYDLAPAYIILVSCAVMSLKIIRLQTQRRLIFHRCRKCMPLCTVKLQL